MKSVKSIMAMLLVCLAGSPAFAVEKITGAFGFKFGEVLDSSNLNGNQIELGDSTLLGVKPRVAHEAFQEYTVEVTPLSKKIYSIKGTGTFASLEAAEEMYDAVLARLEEKYGERSNTSKPREFVTIRGENEYVTLMFLKVANGSGTMRVNYFNAKVAEEGKQEAGAKGLAQVEGAFGLKFGEVFDVSKAIDTIKATDGQVFYEVKPPTPNSYFDRYFISVTAKTKMITEIRARGPVADAAEGRARQRALVKALEGKYELKRGIFDREDANILIQKSKSIVVKSRKSADEFILELIYSDSSFSAQIKKEAAEAVTAAPDNKGL